MSCQHRGTSAHCRWRNVGRGCDARARARRGAEAAFADTRLRPRHARCGGAMTATERANRAHAIHPGPSQPLDPCARAHDTREHHRLAIPTHVSIHASVRTRPGRSACQRMKSLLQPEQDAPVGGTSVPTRERQPGSRPAPTSHGCFNTRTRESVRPLTLCLLTDSMRFQSTPPQGRDTDPPSPHRNPRCFNPRTAQGATIEVTTVSRGTRSHAQATPPPQPNKRPCACPGSRSWKPDRPTPTRR
ncbi:hypothetical protein NB717_001802 [Xanthomonas sacchari]|nr:hypothetical protein [Xanthomonas sacchari]